jgi:prepilin-type N-terminal cleavage/methylation domain-containing protein
MRKAFTLVELLVVIGIIAVLIGIIVPTALRAHESAKSVACLSNLGQIARAAVAYAGTNGRFPPSHLAVRRGTTTYNTDWDYSYVAGQRPTPGVIWSSGGGGNSGTPAVNRCPSWDGRQLSAAGTAEHSGYNYNVSYVGGARM